MDALLNDLRYAARTLARSPGFAALTILCLALGIGVNSAIYSIVDTVSIRPLPFKDPDSIVVLQSTQPATGNVANVSFLDLRDWREQSRVFVDMAGLSARSMTIADGDDAERFLGGVVSWNLFPMLGVQPVVGRQFTADDDRIGATPVVLLGHGVWQRRYAGDAAIVGRVIHVNGVPHTVVGVMPPKFEFPQITQLWTPLAPAAAGEPRDNRSVLVFARTGPGASLAAARADVAEVAGRLTTYRENEGWSATAISLREELMPSDVTLITTTMMGAVSLVLLIACANVANLLLARATSRQREIAVRAALGAGRGRIVRQMLTESVLTASLAAPLGVAIAYVGLQMLTAAVPAEGQVPYYVDWSMNRRVVAYAAIVSVVTGFVFGLAPALQAADADLQRSLKDGGRGSGGSVKRNRVRNGLVVAEIALSLVLLVGASLFVRSFLNLQKAGPGFDPAPLMTLRFFMAGEPYAPADARVRRVEDVVRRIEALPGVDAAFASNLVPLSGGGGFGGAVPEGIAIEEGKEPYVSYLAVTPHALRTLRVPLLAGRDFADAEGYTRSTVAIVNRDFVRRMWPGLSDVIGRRFRLLNDSEAQWLTVVGIVGDFRLYNVRDDEPAPVAFVSYPYMPAQNTGLTIRVSGMAPAAITASVREEIRKADPALPLFNIRTGEENRLINFWQDRLFGWMFSIFGAVALLLASIGVYGVLSYSVAQRSQEIGVRVALGASRRDVFTLILAQGARLAALGIGIGIAGAMAITRVVQTLLYNVSTTDPLSFAGMAIFLGMTAVLAGYLPARRATSVDPIVALRAE